MDLSIERWEVVTRAEREAIAKDLAKQLPLGFTFQAIKQYQLGEHRHHVALYEKENATFVLVPGGSVSLGYDASRPFNPNSDELESWQGTAEEYGIAKTLQEHIAH